MTNTSSYSPSRKRPYADERPPSFSISKVPFMRRYHLIPRIPRRPYSKLYFHFPTPHILHCPLQKVDRLLGRCSLCIFLSNNHSRLVYLEI